MVFSAYLSGSTQCRGVVVVGHYRLDRDAAARGGGKHLLDDVLAERALARQFDRVIAVEAGRAQSRRGLLGGGDHALTADVAERIRADGPAHAVDHLLLVGLEARRVR